MASRQATSKSQLPALIISFVAFVVLGLIVFGQSIKGPFIWDDGEMVYDNQFVRAGNGLLSIWSGKDVDYFPVTSAAFWIEWRMFGDNPAGYRVVNILLHASSSFLIWRILKRLKLPGAGMAAAIYCVHPVCVGTVAWVAELKNTLSVFFALLSTLVFLRARPRENTSQPKWNWQLYVVSIIAFALALLSKISVVMLPFVLLALINWRKRSEPLRVAPFFMLSLACGLLGVWFQQHRAMVSAQSTDIAPMLSRILGGGYALWFYCSKVLLPINLMPIYPHLAIDSRNLLAWMPLVLWLVLLSLLWMSRKKWTLGSVAFFCLMFFTVTAIPVLGIVPISFLLQTQVADHLQYFPMIGLVAVVGFAVHQAAVRFGPAAKRQGGSPFTVRAAAVCLVLVLSSLSFARARLFSDAEALWRDNIRKNPGAPMAWANLADLLDGQGHYDQAIDAYRRSIELDPGNLTVRENLANTLNKTGRFDEALEQLRAVSLRQPNVAHLHNNIGILLMAKGHFTEAVAEFQVAVKLAPANSQTHLNLGDCYARLGKLDDAIAEFEQVLRISPGDKVALTYLQHARIEKENRR